MVDYDRLRSTLASLSDEYRTASPFPHAVVDGVFDRDVLSRVAGEFPAPQAMSSHIDRPREVKFAEPRWEAFGPATRAIVAEMNSGPFLDALSTLTGIPDLIADAHLNGGGQHQIARGGRLGVHADFNRHYGNGLDRRLNVLLYLNPEWQPEWGGQLELWNASMTEMTRSVEPVLGRMVVFSTTSTSFHGHPDPLRCPPDRFRRSLALYYYTNGRDDSHQRQGHSTLFQARPGSRKDQVDRLLYASARWIPPAVSEYAARLVARAREHSQPRHDPAARSGRVRRS